MNDSRLLTRICLISVTVASWMFTLLCVAVLVGGLVLWGDVSAAISNLTVATEQLAAASGTLSETIDNVARGPNLIRSLIELVAALVEMFGSS